MLLVEAVQTADATNGAGSALSENVIGVVS